MSLLKYVDRLKRMDDLIRRKATGNAKEFSRKINISQSQLFAELKEMRELGAPIEYCTVTKSYFYSKDCRLILDFVESGRLIRGGINDMSAPAATNQRWLPSRLDRFWNSWIKSLP